MFQNRVGVAFGACVIDYSINRRNILELIWDLPIILVDRLKYQTI